MSLVRILILAGAAVAAIVAAILVNGAANAPKSAPTEQSASGPRVLVAARDIAIGARLAPEDLAWRAWPADGIGPSMTTEAQAPQALTETTGAFARQDISQGMPINSTAVVKPGDKGFMAAILTPGARAVALPVSVETAAGGFILPGDRVDVIVTTEVDAQSRGGFQRDKKIVAATVLQNVRVLAIDQSYQTVKDGETLQGSSATLELLPKQAEALERAKKQGDVALALRSVGDGPADMRLAGGQGTVGASAGDQPQAAVRVHGYSMMSETLFSAQ